MFTEHLLESCLYLSTFALFKQVIFLEPQFQPSKNKFQSVCVCVCVCAESLSCVQLMTP